MQRPELIQDSSGVVRVSIVVPVFNAAPFLSTSIGSLTGQTVCDWELVLVDDGSTDDSARICEQYVHKDARIRLVKQSNRGPSAARNAGVRVARGEFVMFMDADDYLLPDALENLLAATEVQGADMVLGNFCKQEGDDRAIPQPVVFQPDGEPFVGEYQTLSGMALLDYVRHFFSHPSNHLVSYCWARLYRRSLIQLHVLEADEDMRLFEDFAFNLDYLSKTRSLVFVNKPVYVYVLHRQHVSASMAIIESQRLVCDMQAFRSKVEHFVGAIGVSEALAEQVRREVGHTLVHYAVIFLVRTCRQLNAANRQAIFKEIRGLVNSTTMRESLPCYEPRPGNSRIVPILMRLRLIRLLAFVCQQKGNRRYGKLENTAS